MASEATLHYFDGRGKGEIVRMMLCAAGIQFKEVFLSENAEFEKLKADGELMFNQLPLLKIDGLNLIQSGSIVRFLADRAGLAGTNAADKVRADMLAEGANDFLSQAVMGMQWTENDDQLLNHGKTTLIPKYLPRFEKALSETGTGYLVGSSLTYADIRLCEILLSVVDYFGEEALEPYPNVKKNFQLVKAHKGIENYLKNYRKRKNDTRYVTEVKRVLKW